jgi:hypothetical protein
MESRGYQFVRSGVKIKVKDLFSTGAIYVKHPSPAKNEGDAPNA